MAKVFHSLQRQNLCDQIVEQIGLSILRNDFQPGDALSSEPQHSLQFNLKRPVTDDMHRALGLHPHSESERQDGSS